MPKKEKRFSSFLNKPFDFCLCITVILLLSLGIVMVLSASSPSSLSETGSSYTYVKKQLEAAALGLVAMFFLSKMDYRFFKKYYRLAYLGAFVILLFVLIPGIGVSAGGAKRWIKIGIQFQPSELTKIGLIVFYAAYLSKNKDKLSDFKEGFVKTFAYLVPVILVLVLVQDHLSASLVIVIIASVMMIIAGTKFKYFVIFGTVGIVVGGLALWGLAEATGKGAFRIGRIISFMDPWADATGDGWQVIQGLYAIGSGGLFGAGLGEGKQKFLYISEPHNDFIFAVLAEELGFIGCVIVILLFAIFIWRGILIAMKAQDTFGSLLAVGITTLIGVQAIINIAVVTSSMPVTGMALPFFSYGGTSLVILLCSCGILLNISRSCSKV